MRLFDVFAKHEIGGELKKASTWLDEHPTLLGLVAGNLRRDGVQETGRHGLPAEAVLRCALLRQSRQAISRTEDTINAILAGRVGGFSDTEHLVITEAQILVASPHRNASYDFHRGLAQKPSRAAITGSGS